MRKSFISLRNRNFRLYFSGQIVSNTGNWLTNVALTLLMLKLTHSGLAVGLLAACQYGPILLFTAWGGAIADRRDKRQMLLLTQSLEMIESIGLATFAFMPHPPLVALFMLALTGGILLSFDSPLRRSFVSEMVRPEDVPNAVVVYSMTINVARIIGPALAGLLVVTLGYGWCFTVDAVSYLAVLVCLGLMRPAELHRHTPTPRAKGEIRAGLRYILSVPTLWISFAMLAAIGALSYNFGVTLPLFVTEGLHKTTTTYTVLYSVYSLGAVASGLVVARRRLVRMRHVIIGSLALGFTMLLLASAPGLAEAVPVVFLVGMSSILYMTSTTALAQLETRPEMRGRVLALQSILVAGPAAIGGPLLGWLADSVSGRAPLILGGAVAVLASAFGYAIAKRMSSKFEAAKTIVT